MNLTFVMDWIKYSAKAVLATAGTFIASWLVANQDQLESWAAAIVGSIVVGVVTWLKANGPKP